MSVDVIEIVGALIGCAYIVSEYKAHVSLWYIGILMSLFYVYIFFASNLYANMGIYLYNLGANIYGLAVWTRRNRAEAQSESFSVTHCPKRYYLLLILVSLLCSVGLSFLLYKTAESQAPICDAVSAALGVVAMWLMAHKYVEHWLFWIVVEVISSVMCALSGLYASAIMFGLYFVMAILGYFNWKKMMK